MLGIANANWVEIAKLRGFAPCHGRVGQHACRRPAGHKGAHVCSMAAAAKPEMVAEVEGVRAARALGRFLRAAAL